MARFNASQAENYGGQGGAGFFSLRNDGDFARVRFMYDTIDDVEGMSVHEVQVNDKKRYVNCLREYNEPMSKCPFCQSGMNVQAKLFVPVYDTNEDKVKIWEREKEFEIERHGAKGDTNTTYEIWPVDDSIKMTLEDLPEIPADFNTFVLDKSAEDMECYLDTGSFPPADTEEEAPRRRGRSNDDEVPFEENRRSSRQATRRTPANSRRRSEEDVY